MASDRPVVVDVVCDPNVPPIPPHISFEQARQYLASFIKGDPDASAMARLSFRDVLATWLPGKE